MKKTVKFVSALTGMALGVFGVCATAADLYVDAKSRNGNGSISNPFSTIEEAQAAVRKINSNMSEDINVYLRGGTYFIDNTVLFKTEDSGSNGYYVNYRAYKDEKPVINGAKEIGGWKLHDAERNIYAAPACGIQTRQLYVNGKRAVRARSDKSLTEAKKTETGYLCDDFYLTELKRPQDLEFVWVVLWTNPRCGVSEITKNKDGKTEITMKQPGWKYVTSNVRGSQVNVTAPSWMENAYEFLDEPGEFYLNTDEDMFYYIPREDEDLSEATVYAPFVEELLKAEGDSIDRKVHNIRFDGIAFNYSTWNRPSTSSGHSDTQCNYLMDTEGSYHRMISAAVTLKRAENVPFENCEISKVGSIGIKLEEGTQYSDVIGNHIYDISGTGIALGEVVGQTVFSYDSRYFCRGNDVKNNLIEDVGVDYMSSVGISAGHPMESEISHNEIIGSNYSGMHIGYGWGNYVNTGTNLRDFRICDNIVAETMKVCHDGGGIYVLGATGGTSDNMNEISGNYIYDTYNPNGILYSDEGSNYWEWKNNVVDQYGIEKGRWYLIWKDSIHYINMTDNFTTRKDFTNNSPTCPEIGTVYAPDAEWTQAALDIIDNAGLEPQYAARMKGFDKNSVGKIIASLPENIKKGESIALDYKVKSKGGRTMTSYTTQITSSDESIIKIDGNKITAAGEGTADITVTAEKDGVKASRKFTIISNDILNDIFVIPNNNIVAVGNGRKISVEGKTKFGKSIDNGMNISFESLNPQIASVSSDGTVTAVKEGNFTLRITAEYDGVKITKDFEYQAVMPGNSAELDGYAKYKLNDEVKSAGGWFYNDGNAETDNDGINLWGTFLTYKNKYFKDELIEFNMTLKGDISWPTITFNNSRYDVCSISPNVNSYIIVIKSGEIELQRWINGTGTMIYGSAPGRETIEKEVIKNEYISANEPAYIQVGTFDEAAGVRILFWVNGQKVIDYLDSSDDALRGGGYFGVLEQTKDRKIHLAEPKVIIKEPEQREEVFDDLTGHWSKETVEKMYELGFVKGKGNGKFAPNDVITRAEYITMALRAAGIEITGESERYFEDSDSLKWYNSALNTALDNSLIDINMIENGKIYPDKAITREEMASVAARICKIKNVSVLYDDISRYKDSADISEWAEKYFEIVCAYGIFKGNGDMLLQPHNTASRAEAVSVINGINSLNK